MKKSARQFVTRCRALLFALFALSVLVPVFAGQYSDYRVAAVILSQPDSMVLIEDAGGTQKWFKVGDRMGSLEVTQIDDDGATLRAPDGELRLSLRGDRSSIAAQSGQESATPATERSRSFQYLSLVSRIAADTAMEGENREQAITRTLNSAFELNPGARITAIDRVDVTTAAEARAELQRHLSEGNPVRIAIENDDLKVLYVVPEQ